MVTVIIKRTAEANVVQLTQESIMRELNTLRNCEMLLENSWAEGLKKVRTPFVCLVEPDCVFSPLYFSTNLSIFHRNTKGQEGRGKGGGGYTKLAMLASCICLNNFEECYYGWSLDGGFYPERLPVSTEPYHVQIAAVPGAILRYSSIKDVIDKVEWDAPVKDLSMQLSLHLWDTGRRIKVNPSTQYVTTNLDMAGPVPLHIPITAQVQRLFDRNFDILNNPKVRL